MSSVPSDVYKIYLIEPADTTSGGTYRNLIFVPRDYNSKEFNYARTLSAQDPTQRQVIYYALTGQGAPIAAPTVRIGPTVSSAIAAGSLRFVYYPTLAATDLEAGDVQNYSIRSWHAAARLSVFASFRRRVAKRPCTERSLFRNSPVAWL